MDPAPDSSIQAVVVASAPLLRAGLERAVLAAGLQPTSESAGAAIGLHTPDTAPTGTSMDLSVDANLVTISLNGVPERETWNVAWALVAELFDAVPEPPRTTSPSPRKG